MIQVLCLCWISPNVHNGGGAKHSLITVGFSLKVTFIFFFMLPALLASVFNTVNACEWRIFTPEDRPLAQPLSVPPQISCKHFLVLDAVGRHFRQSTHFLFTKACLHLHFLFIMGETDGLIFKNKIFVR